MLIYALLSSKGFSLELHLSGSARPQRFSKSSFRPSVMTHCKRLYVTFNDVHCFIYMQEVYIEEKEIYLSYFT